jgi:hypothetical protein
MSIVPLVAGYFAIQWNRANFMGKSPEQIVAMGLEKWSELYGKKFGQGTHQVCDAEEKYGIALKNLNDRAMTKLPKTRQVWLRAVRKETKEYAVEAHQIGSIISGGGTMWQTFDATISPDIEQTIADCIVNKPLPVLRMKSFESDIQSLDKVIAEFRGEGRTSSAEYREVAKHRIALASKQKVLTGLLSSGRESDSTRFQLYMHRKIEVARGDNLHQ